jgi:iron complex outermembrane receptor protein
LKGPQGDLYGRNTTAGAVNIISRKPSEATDVQFEAGYGTYGSWQVDGAAGGALTSNLTARFAMQTVQQESGWQTNYLTGQKVGKIDRTNGRLQLLWKPSADFSILVNATRVMIARTSRCTRPTTS